MIESAKDKAHLLWSPLGAFSMLRKPYIISVFDDDGQLNYMKLTAMVQWIANAGANGMRDFFWIHNERAVELLSPFRLKPGNGIQFNFRFFEAQRTIAAVCELSGVRYYYSLFDHCGTKGDMSAFNPWNIFRDFFYGEAALGTCYKYIDKVMDGFRGLDYGLELCNEPKAGQAKWLANIFIYLIKKGMNPGNIILGTDYYLKKSNSQYMKDYMEFRERVAAELGDEWEKRLKTACITPIHNATTTRIDKVWDGKVEPGGQRQMMYSWDGVRPRPDYDEVYEMATKVLEAKWRAREKGKVHFEVVLGKEEGDPLDSFLGIAAAYREIYGENPSNWGKYPDAVFPYREENGNDAELPEKKLKDLENKVEALQKEVQGNRVELERIKEYLIQHHSYN
jgi:hypothetical protein